ncbi:MAG: recombinase family protein [Firmicutes bacterium]|nr:recombinase family protein [Bacillota bacterium]
MAKNNENSTETVYVVGYCRYSSDNQNRETIESQKSYIRSYAERFGYKIIHWYVDEAVSGSTSNRPAFKQMIADAKKRKFKYIVVYKLDRFARNKGESYSNKFELKKHGVAVRSASENIDDSPEGKMMEAMLEMMAEYHNDNQSVVVKDNMRHNASKGGFNGGTVGFGYKKAQRLDEHGNPMLKSNKLPYPDIAINEEEAEGIRIIFEKTLLGIEYSDIIDELTARGFKSKKGNRFTYSSLENILRNERYMGVYTYGKTKKDMRMDGTPHYVKNEDGNVVRCEKESYQIISKDLFMAVQDYLDRRKHKPPAIAIDDYLLSSRIQCGECGDTYRGQRKERKSGNGFYNFYKCQARRTNEDGTAKENKCTNSTVSRDILEKAIIEEIKELISTNNILQVERLYNEHRVRKFGSGEEEMKKYESQINAIEVKITSAVEKLMMEEDSNIANRIRVMIDELENQKKDLQNRMEQNNKQRQEVKINPKEFNAIFSKIRTIMNGNSHNKKMRLIDTLLNKVLVFQDRVEIFLNVLPQPLNSSLKADVNAKTFLQTLHKNEVNLSESVSIIKTSDLASKIISRNASTTNPNLDQKPNKIAQNGKEKEADSSSAPCLQTDGGWLAKSCG